MKIVVSDRNLLPHRTLFESKLPSHCEVSWHKNADESALSDDLADADVFVGGRFSAALASAAPQLRLVHVAGAGTDGIEFESLPTSTLLANTFHHERSIAEYVAATAVLLRRGFLSQDSELRKGRWASPVYDPALQQSPAFGSATVGFVGFGHIGERSWQLMRAFGCNGVAVTGSGSVDAAAHGLNWAASTDKLTELLTESDVVVVSAPLNSATTGMIGAAELAALGPDGILVNVGRGRLVQEGALFDALSSRALGAAAIDVWYDYPNPDGQGAPSHLPFGILPNLVMTPHSSGITRDTFEGRVGDITANIVRLDSGEPLLNLVSTPQIPSKEPLS